VRVGSRCTLLDHRSLDASALARRSDHGRQHHHSYSCHRAHARRLTRWPCRPDAHDPRQKLREKVSHASQTAGLVPRRPT
jgi:hypothetical protein